MSKPFDVLIVDDKTANLFALNKTLAELDCTVFQAHDGHKALAATLDHDFALAILDVQMPGFTGFELAELLRGDEKTKSIPIIFLTAAQSAQEYEFKGYQAGAVDYIIKPYNPSILLSKVNVFLKIYGQTQELQQKNAQLKTLVAKRTKAEHKLKVHAELLHLLRETATNANSSTNFSEAMQSCLDTVCKHTGWPVGHAYIVSDKNKNLLVSSGIWHVDNPERFAAFLEATNKTTFKRGQGLPGGVFASGEPAWIVDVAKNANFIRVKWTQDVGVHGAFAFPVLTGNKVVAVLEFFDEKVDEPDETLLATIIHIGAQLGRVYERDKAEAILRTAMDEIDKANQSLSHKVRMRTRELNVAKDEAEFANRTKSEFLANMSHELRTPLNAIIGFSEIIMATMYGPIESRYQEYAQHINTSGQHLLRLITDILDLSKVEIGELEIEEEEVDLVKSVADCEVMLRRRIEKAGLNFTLNVSADLPLFYADPLRLKQILLNLIGNAIKFTQKGGQITVTGEVNAGGNMLVKVRDNGIGIAKDDIPKVLEKFGQARNGHMQAHEGAGLGLALTKSLMERHGGSLEIESEVGEGTVITVLFPPTQNKMPPSHRASSG